MRHLLNWALLRSNYCQFVRGVRGIRDLLTAWCVLANSSCGTRMLLGKFPLLIQEVPHCLGFSIDVPSSVREILLSFKALLPPHTHTRLSLNLCPEYVPPHSPHFSLLSWKLKELILLHFTSDTKTRVGGNMESKLKPALQWDLRTGLFCQAKVYLTSFGVSSNCITSRYDGKLNSVLSLPLPASPLLW